jgi:hypothetical protein
MLFILTIIRKSNTKSVGGVKTLFNVNADGIHKSSQYCELQGQNGQKNTLLARKMLVPNYVF